MIERRFGGQELSTLENGSVESLSGWAGLLFYIANGIQFQDAFM